MVTEKVATNFECKSCYYTTSKKSSFDKHLLTAKHKSVTNGDEKVAKCPHLYSCSICDKVYNSRNGLWCHSKKCSPNNAITENPPPVIDIALVLDLIKQNKELQNVLIQESREKTELIHKLAEREPVTINGNNNNNTINNNQKFNLNFFLNETCKDAMNIQDFMENLRITFQDLLKIGNDGFVSGVSDIFIKELRDLDINKRPIHCTDAKRETIYVKENGEWNKDDADKTRLKQIIEKVEYKNVAALQQWCNENPDTKVNNTDNNLLRDKIYLQTLQGDERTRDKIIKNIAKEVVVDKE